MGKQTGNIAELIVAIASGQSHKEAAAAAGMSISSVQRRLREPQIAAAVEQALVDLTRQAQGRIRSLRGLALDRLTEILTSRGDPTHTLRAADLVLRNASAADNAWLHQRLAFLEQQLTQEPEDAADDARGDQSNE
jgi:hypothetical protein